MKQKNFEVSPDRIAIKGRNNYLFLFEGFNRYYEMYFDRKSKVVNVISGWRDCLSRWQEVTKVKSSDLHFIVVPNKATLLNTYYPVHLPNRETPYLSHLKQQTNVKVFCPESIQGIFRQNDTHLSPKGNFEFANFIIKTLGFNFNLGNLTSKGFQEIVGDLGSKFIPPIAENVEYFASLNVFKPPQVVLDNSAEYLPDRHIGIEIQLVNPNAMFKRDLRIFGNSFLGNSSEYSTLWLLGLAFQKVSFHWSPIVMPELIEKEDIVIFQTCERFLGYAPDHWK